MPLSGFRILDLAQDRGLYAGRLLADLGAEVIKIEEPAGDRARGRGPFKDDVPDPESSLYFINFNTNKKSVTLNLKHNIGKKIFKQLLAKADVVLEDFQPGIMESLGLGYPVLRECKKKIIVTSITAFGRTGPYSHYRAPDIVNFAMGGLMYISGEPDKPPVVAPCEQAYHSAAVLAFFGTLVALYHGRTTGVGQLVEISTQEALAVQEHLIMRYGLESDIVRRRGSQHTTAPSRIYPCRDGYVHIFVSPVEHWRSLLEMMGNPETLKGEAWEDVRFRRLNIDIIDPVVTEFTMKYGRKELTALFQSRRIPCTPVNTPGEFIDDVHVKERNFIASVVHPAIGRHGCLRRPYGLSEAPVQAFTPAPLLGQHNEEIYCRELGYTREDLDKFKADGVT